MELNGDGSHCHGDVCPQATGVDKEGKKVKFADGEDIGYDKLLLATGSKSVHTSLSLVLTPSSCLFASLCVM